MRLSKLARPASTVLLSLLVGLGLGCATPPVDDGLAPAKTLLAEGRLKEGLDLLNQRVAQHPTDASARIWVARTRDRYASGLIAQAEDRWRQGDAQGAEAAYRELGAVAGFEASAREHIAKLQASRTALAAPPPDTALRLDRELRLSGRAPVATASSTPDAPASTIARAMKKRISLQFRDAPVRSLFDVIGRTANLAIVFDRDMPPELKLSIAMKDVTIQAAIEQVSLSGGLSWRVLDAGTLLVYPDTPTKQSDYQGLMVRSFYLTNADARFVANSMKTLLKSRDIVVDTKINMIVVRDTPEGLRLAEQLVQMQDVPEPEVMLEVEVLEVKRTLLEQLGIEWPGQLSLSPLPSVLQVPGTAFDRNAPVTLRDILRARSRTVEGLLGNPLTINARREDGDVNILATPRLRAKSREKARIMIGERVPNITSTSTATGFVAESVNYVDVGLKLEVEPQVYAGGEVVIKLALEVSNIIDQTTTRSGSTAYRISTRNANTVLRLKDGENQLLAGLIQDEDQRNDARVPGLGDLPLVGRLFGSQRDGKAKTEIVLSITPRLIRPLQRPSAAQSMFELGTASGIRGRQEEGAAPEPEAAVEPAPKSGDSPATDAGSKGR